MTETEPLPQAIAESELTILGVTLKCHVLDDGRRIIDADDLEAFFKAMADPDGPPLTNVDSIQFAKFVKGL